MHNPGSDVYLSSCICAANIPFGVDGYKIQCRRLPFTGNQTYSINGPFAGSTRVT